MIRRTLWIEPDTIQVVVHDGVVRLEGQVERRSLLPVARPVWSGPSRASSAVDDRLTYAHDDGPKSDFLLPWTAPMPAGDR